jgi:hypothetical protein
MASKIFKLNILLIILGLISSINSKSVTYQQMLGKPGFSSSEHQVLFQKVRFYATTVQYLHVVIPILLEETINSLVQMSDELGQYQKDQLTSRGPRSGKETNLRDLWSCIWSSWNLDGTLQHCGDQTNRCQSRRKPQKDQLHH